MGRRTAEQYRSSRSATTLYPYRPLLWSGSGALEVDDIGSLCQLCDGSLLMFGTTVLEEAELGSRVVEGRDRWMVRLSPQGTIVWQHCFGGATSTNSRVEFSSPRAHSSLSERRGRTMATSKDCTRQTGMRGGRPHTDASAPHRIQQCRRSQLTRIRRGSLHPAIRVHFSLLNPAGQYHIQTRYSLSRRLLQMWKTMDSTTLIHSNILRLQSPWQSLLSRSGSQGNITAMLRAFRNVNFVTKVPNHWEPSLVPLRYLTWLRIGLRR